MPGSRGVRPSRWSRALDRRLQRWLPADQRPLALLVLLTLVLGALLFLLPAEVPLIVLLAPMVVASMVLGPRQLPWFVVFVLLVLALISPRQPVIDVRTLISVALVFAIGLFILFSSFRRTPLGVAGVRGESMLVDLRDRILKQGRIPALPEDWYAVTELRSAGGTLFAGDFLVAARQDRRFDVVVVDVSGKGERAGTRALLLSGALGGLLGALPHHRFLPAANDYLLRQEWDEGFATAVHLCVDLETGDFRLRSAGHPPAVHWASRAGRWRTLEVEGPALGLLDGAEFATVAGRLERGDAILLYTDGLVESQGRDISLGIDRMIGQAERLLSHGFDDGAARLIDAVGSEDDDRALVVVHRR